MKKILLGIVGFQPHETTLRYCLALASRIKANVEILQVLTSSAGSRLKRLHRSLQKGAHLFESKMVSVSFAEAGEHATARHLEEMLATSIRELLCPDEIEKAPKCSVNVTTGDPEVEISRFVSDHPDVVLAICDATDADAPDSPECRLLARKLKVPAVTIQPKKSQKGKQTSMKAKLHRRKAAVRALVFGALSACLYGVVFFNQATVTTFFTRGHLFALLPVGAVFAFSYIHGSFASNVWTALGIEASSKKLPKQVRKDRRERIERPQPRAVVRA